MDEERQFEGLLAVLDELAEANRATPILVEGRRDMVSLRALGCKGEILALHSGEPLFPMAERLAATHREIILLPDWDRKGETLFDTMQAYLSTHGVRIDRSYRDRIPYWVRMPLKDVESLSSYVARGLERFHRLSLAERMPEE